jgi:hypothetical protein
MNVNHHDLVAEFAAPSESPQRLKMENTSLVKFLDACVAMISKLERLQGRKTALVVKIAAAANKQRLPLKLPLGAMLIA